MKLKDKNLYYIGGVVRDEILNTPSFDTDLCYEGDAIKFSKNLQVIKTNPDFGTVRILYENQEIDIASTREEDYPQPGGLPVVKNIGCSLKEDLKRRDFTINAMAKNTVTGEIIDYFGGLEDIKNKTLRILHNNSFIDDPTRIIRGLKFSIRFGFELDKNTQELQNKYLENIDYNMSFHRVKKELKETFNLNKEEALQKFINSGIYKLLGKSQKIPNVTTGLISNLINEFKPKNIWLVYMGLFDLSNLDLTSEEQKIISSVPENIPQTDFETYLLFKGLPLETVLLYAVKNNKDIALNYLRKLKDIKIEITGNDLKELGIPSGKIYKDILDYILENKIKMNNSNKQQELIWAKEKYKQILSSNDV